MRFIFRLFLLVIVVGVVWAFRAPILDRLGLVAGTPAREPARETTGPSSATPSSATQPTTRGRLSDVDLSVDSIARELSATGRVVRRKVAEAGHQLEESTRDARTTAKLKARFALDPELKGRDISVATADGRVTLTGRVDSHEELARAVRMAVEEDDVLEITSTLQVGAGRTSPSGR